MEEVDDRGANIVDIVEHEEGDQVEESLPLRQHTKEVGWAGTYPFKFPDALDCLPQLPWTDHEVARSTRQLLSGSVLLCQEPRQGKDDPYGCEIGNEDRVDFVVLLDGVRPNTETDGQTEDEDEAGAKGRSGQRVV